VATEDKPVTAMTPEDAGRGIGAAPAERLAAELAALRARVSAVAAKFTTCAAEDFKAAAEQGGSTAHGLRGAGQAEADCARELLEAIGAPAGDLPGPKTLDGIAAMPGVTTVLSAPHCAVVRDGGEVVSVIGMTASGLRQYESEAEYEAENPDVGAALHATPAQAARYKAERDQIDSSYKLALAANEDLLRQIDGLRVQLAEAEEAGDKLAGGLDLYHRAVSSHARSLYATWIDLMRNQAPLATRTLREALDGFDGPAWDGKETGQQWLERARAISGDDDPGDDPAVVRDLLLVAGDDVPLEVISGWSSGQRTEVADWAAAEHLHASDNDVMRLRRPPVLGGGR